MERGQGHCGRRCAPSWPKKQLGKRGESWRCHLAHGPLALDSYETPDQNQRGVHGLAEAGARLLAARDAGLQPAVRLPRSRYRQVRLTVC